MQDCVRLHQFQAGVPNKLTADSVRNKRRAYQQQYSLWLQRCAWKSPSLLIRILLLLHFSHSSSRFPLFPWQRAPFLPLCLLTHLPPSSSSSSSSSYVFQSKQEAGGLGCDVVRVEVEESLTKELLLETFISCGKTNTHTHKELQKYSKYRFHTAAAAV